MKAMKVDNAWVCYERALQLRVGVVAKVDLGVRSQRFDKASRQQQQQQHNSSDVRTVRCTVLRGANSCVVIAFNSETFYGTVHAPHALDTENKKEHKHTDTPPYTVDLCTHTTTQ
eukprot:16449-Heterococcus_DN1.PRE.2